VLGVFVGGASRRMNGRPKGLLPSPETGEPLVVRLARIGLELGLEVVLVGRAPSAPRWCARDRARGRPEGVGPLGGLAALLEHAGTSPAVAIACDQPFVTAGCSRGSRRRRRSRRSSRRVSHRAARPSRSQRDTTRPGCGPRCGVC